MEDYSVPGSRKFRREFHPPSMSASLTCKGTRGKRLRSKRNYAADTPDTSGSIKKSRNTGSLGPLTQKFVELMQSSSDGMVNLKMASRNLNVPIRRIYDITHVLQGIGLIERKGVGNIQWKGAQLPDVKTNLSTLKREIKDFEAMENRLDQLINSAEGDYRKLCSNEQFSYVTRADLGSVPHYKNQAIMVGKASIGSTLHVQHSTTTLKGSTQRVHMRSSSGEVEVFLCPDDHPPIVDNSAVVETTVSMKAHGQVQELDIKNRDGRVEAERSYNLLPCTSVFGIMNDLLTESVVFGTLYEGTQLASARA